MSKLVTNYGYNKMWIDGKCFNIKKFREKTQKVEVLRETEPKREYSLFNIVKESDGRLTTSFQLPNVYYRKLKNFHNFNIETLALNTNTQITVPETLTENLVISGQEECKVIEARNEIHSVIAEIRNQTKPLQFLSIRTNNEDIIRRFLSFKEEVLSLGNIKGIEDSIFQSPLKLHLTINVFCLLNDREVEEAKKCLQQYKITIIEPLLQKTGPLKIRISGLDCMNANLKKVDVLYAKATIVNTDNYNLQKILNELSEYFYDTGLVKEHKENVKIHMTLLNTRYRKIVQSPKHQKWVKKQSFDATKIIEKYKDYYFGDCNFDSIHLSVMSTIAKDGFYKSLSCITF